MKWKSMMKSVPYDLSKPDLYWMRTFLMVEGSGNKKNLRKLSDDKQTVDDVSKELRRARNSRERDILRHPEAMKEYANEIRQTVTDYATQEERLAGALDLLRDWEKQKQFKPYGTATDLGNGDKVLVAVEGHSLQNRTGIIAGQRAGQYLVEVETRNGTVRAYLNARDLTVISKARF